MVSINHQHRRRITLPLVVLLLLHWLLGIGETAAAYICLEPDGHAKLEFAGKRCNEPVDLKASANDTSQKHCIDLPADDENSGDEPGPASQASTLAVALPFILPMVLYDIPLINTHNSPLTAWIPLHPHLQNRTIAYRETTVLLI